jgi:hypothetical protein
MIEEIFATDGLLVEAHPKNWSWLEHNCIVVASYIK